MASRADRLLEQLGALPPPTSFGGRPLSFRSWRPESGILGRLDSDHDGSIDVLFRKIAIGPAEWPGMQNPADGWLMEFGIAVGEDEHVRLLAQGDGIVFREPGAVDEFLDEDEWKRRRLDRNLWKSPNWLSARSALWPTVEGEPCCYVGRLGWSSDRSREDEFVNSDIVLFRHGRGAGLKFFGCMDFLEQQGDW